MKSRSEHGFTILETLIVIMLLGLMVLLGVTSFDRYRQNQRDNIRAADIDVIRLALEEYKNICNEYPNLLELDADNGCSSDPEFDDFNELADFLHQIPVDPLTGAEYRYAGLSMIGLGFAKCRDYHLAATLERSDSSLLDADHDADDTGLECQGVGLGVDFDGTDDPDLLYDFRSTSE